MSVKETLKAISAIVLLFTVGSSAHAKIKYGKIKKPFKIMNLDQTRTLVNLKKGDKLVIKPCASCTEDELKVTKGKYTFKISAMDVNQLKPQEYSSVERFSFSEDSEVVSGTSQTISSRAASNDSRNKVSSQRFSSGQSSKFLSCYEKLGNRYTKSSGCHLRGNRTVCGKTKSISKSYGLCYRYVKLILKDCGATRGYMSTSGMRNGKITDFASWAHSKGGLKKQGFTKLNTLDPDKAPKGSVVVYKNMCTGTHPAGHIEIKVSNKEYVSEFKGSMPISQKTKCRKVTGIYFK